MKLLTPNAGWAATTHNIFWTADGGASWKDITPKLIHKSQQVSSIYFIDAFTGWALLKCGDDRDPVADEGCWAFASTSDGGNGWSVVHEKFDLPPTFTKEYLEDTPGFSGRSWLQFTDAQHGWELLEIATHAGIPEVGEMLRTTDGGKSWAFTNLPIVDHFHFVTAKDGWIAGGDDGELFVTHDAGDSWHKVTVAVPANLGPDSDYSFGLPNFTDNQHGILGVTASSASAPGASVILYSTQDGGRSWKPSATFKDLPNIAYVYPMAALDSAIILVVEAGKGRLRLSSASVDGTINTTTSVLVPEISGVEQLSFINSSNGWILSIPKLFSTSDGGVHWSEVTPGPHRSAHQ
jgi:photosystem II stability/assembly factor-like uncharacterized protein